MNMLIFKYFRSKTTILIQMQEKESSRTFRTPAFMEDWRKKNKKVTKKTGHYLMLA